MRHPRLSQLIVPLLVLILGAGLRGHGLAREARFHPDEALYNTYARDAAIKGDWLFSRPLDKPPLLLYANALSMTFVGVHITDRNVLDFPSVRVGEFAGRLPNTLVSILTLAVVYALAKRLYRDARLAWIAMLLAALSPFALGFSPTAFTDVLMSFWMLVALWLAARDRWGWSGVALALGLASKQPAVFYLPLILAIGYIRAQHVASNDPTPKSPPRIQRGDFLPRYMTHLGRFALVFALGVMVLLLWDAGRGQLSIWQVSAGRENYPAHLIGGEELLPRLRIWLGYTQWLIGSGWLTAILLALASMAILARIRQVQRNRTVQIDSLLLVYGVGYIGLHWLVAFNTFDRYLLPLTPLAAILAARGIMWGLHVIRFDQWKWIPCRGITCYAPTSIFICALVFILFILPTWDASEGRVPIGGDLGQHDGIDQLAAFLNSQPVATVIYDRWLGWELEYYMGPWNDKRRVYYPTPELLVDGALELPETGLRYFPVPSEAPYAAWIAALSEAGFAPQEVYRSPRFIVYALRPPWAVTGASAAG